jgi:hypothetical protein
MTPRGWWGVYQGYVDHVHTLAGRIRQQGARPGDAELFGRCFVAAAEYERKARVFVAQQRQAALPAVSRMASIDVP